jgi:2-polyprenyl-3-methyl-5-hydroxy-6-metoxy-1,4-benzoquinol methylase
MHLQIESVWQVHNTVTVNLQKRKPKMPTITSPVQIHDEDIISPEMQALKARLKATWMSGEYATFAKYMEEGAIEILRRWNIPAGTRVLDVGCGAGQIAIPMARQGIRVTGVDIATNLIEHARARADAERLDAQFDEGDAEDLPYADASFDTVVGLVGAMFAPRPNLVAAELKRVTRPGGRIIMVNWTPAGLVGQMFKIIGKHVPPPSGMTPPVLWGDPETVRQRFSDGIAELTLTKKFYPSWDYPFSPAEVVEFFRKYYGPMNRAFAALDADGQAAMRRDLEKLWSENNRNTDGTTCVESEYLEVIAIRA